MDDMDPTPYPEAGQPFGSVAAPSSAPATPSEPYPPAPHPTPTSPFAAIPDPGQAPPAYEQPTGSFGPPGGPPQPDYSWAAPGGAPQLQPQAFPQPFPAPAPPKPPKDRSAKAGGGAGRMAAIALVAALVGGGIGGGVVAATNDDSSAPASSSTRVTQPGGGTPSTDGGISSGSGGSGSVIAEPGSVRELLKKVEPAVVAIRTGDGAGSGMILSADGEVLTNAHVVESFKTVRVTLFGETTSRPATVLGADTENDVALVKINDASGLPTVTLGDSDKLQQGDDVIAIGNALNLSEGTPSVTKGIVSALNRVLESREGSLTNLIQTDAAINPGNSGGPLVNSAGEVVGMNTAVIQQAGQDANGNTELAQNLGFAISTETIKPLLDDLRAGRGGQTPTPGGPLLGVRTRDLTEADGLDISEGAVVVDVTPGSAAANAGIQTDDIITTFDGKKIQSSLDLRNAVRARKPGDKVKATIHRDGKDQEVEVTIGSADQATG